MPSQHKRRNKLPHPSTPLLLLFHIKRFAQQNLAAGGIHFRRGYSFPVRGPRKMPRHFVGTDKSSWTSCILPSQHKRRNKLPHPSTPLLLLFHIKRFAQQNLAAGGIHFRRGYSFPVRGPRKMPRHFVGTDKSSWTSCILPSQPRRRNKLPITSKRSGRCPLLFRLSKNLAEFAARRPRIVFHPFFAAACTSRKILCAERVCSWALAHTDARVGAKSLLSKKGGALF